MNKLLPAALLLLLTSCSTSTREQSAVEAYLKKGLDDPGSYQAVRWSKPSPLHKRQADSLAAEAMMPAYTKEAARAQQGLDSLRDESVETGSAWEASIKRRMLAAAGRADSIAAIGQRLRDSSDTTRVGVMVRHAFRAKNKLGALVLDSAQFIVLKSGEVSLAK